MTANKLKIHVRKPTAAGAIFDIDGQVTNTAEDALMTAYTQSTRDGARSIVLNFSGLDYMNSSGIGLLVTMLIRVQRNKQKLLAYGLTAHYREIFELTRLNEAIGIYADEASALAAP